MQWSRSFLHVQINRGFDSRRRCFLFLCNVFFPCLVYFFFKHYFSFWPFFLYSYCRPCWSCTSINIYFKLKCEFYFGKGISKALDLHTGQAYDQIKTISCQDMSLLWNSWIFSMLVDIMTNTHSTPQTVLIYTPHPPVTHWRKLNLPFVHRL